VPQYDAVSGQTVPNAAEVNAITTRIALAPATSPFTAVLLIGVNRITIAVHRVIARVGHFVQAARTGPIQQSALGGSDLVDMDQRVGGI
jgi:hypothetical protein